MSPPARWTSIEADDQPALDRMQEILDSHLTRFGKREGIQLVWR